MGFFYAEKFFAFLFRFIRRGNLRYFARRGEGERESFIRGGRGIVRIFSAGKHDVEHRAFRLFFRHFLFLLPAQYFGQRGEAGFLRGFRSSFGFSAGELGGYPPYGTGAEGEPGDAEGQFRACEEDESPDQHGAEGAEEEKGHRAQPVARKAASCNIVQGKLPQGRGGEHAGEEQSVAYPAVPFEHQPARDESRSGGKEEDSPQEGAQAEKIDKEAGKESTEEAGGVLDIRSLDGDGLIEGGVAGVEGPEAEEQEQAAEYEEQAQQFANQSVSEIFRTKSSTTRLRR